MIIEVCDMRAAGKPGYVAKIGDQNEKCFLSAHSYSKHGASAKQVSYEIKEDGIYEICDANFGGRKRKACFVLIRGNEIVFESDDLREVQGQEDVADGKLEDWAVCRDDSEKLISDRTVEKPYPGLKQTEELVKPVDVAIEAKDSQLQVRMASDKGFKFFLPSLKTQVRGRKWDGASKAWSVPTDSAMLLRALVEDYSIRTNGIRVAMEFQISAQAKTLMAMEDA